MSGSRPRNYDNEAQPAPITRYRIVCADGTQVTSWAKGHGDCGPHRVEQVNDDPPP